MNNAWFETLFGDEATFAFRVSLLPDAHPSTDDPLLLASWGTLEVWAQGRCLTRNRRSDGSYAEGITWYTLPFMRWLAHAAVRLLNEEPFPPLTSLEKVSSAAEWVEETAEPHSALAEQQEDDWFLQRDEWWGYHALRRAYGGVAAPNILFRRLGHDLEVSWENDRRPAPRSDLEFVSPGGAVLVPVESVAAAIRLLLAEVPARIGDRCGMPLQLSPSSQDLPAWQWLLPRALSSWIRQADHLAELRAQLDGAGVGLAEPQLAASHSPLTLLLRNMPPGAAAQIEPLIKLLGTTTSLSPGKNRLLEVRRPMAPPLRQPWREGYERALALREHLGLDGQPLASLDELLQDNAIDARVTSLHEQIDAATIWLPGQRPLLVENPQGMRSKSWRRSMMLATGLGHLLMDAPEEKPYAELDTPWGYWPAKARARAFAAMFLMPRAGVNEVISQRGKIDVETVRAIMQRFGTGLTATLHHLQNLRQLTEDEYEGLLFELGAVMAGPADSPV